MTEQSESSSLLDNRRLIEAREDIAIRRAVAKRKGDAGTYALAVLAIADLILDRHARTHVCVMRWTDDGTEVGQYLWPVLPCADVKPVLDLYAPVASAPSTAGLRAGCRETT